MSAGRWARFFVVVFIVFGFAAIAGEAAVVRPVRSDADDDAEQLYRALLTNRRLSNDIKYKLLIVMTALNALSSGEPRLQPPDKPQTSAADEVLASDSLVNPVPDKETKRAKFLYVAG